MVGAEEAALEAETGENGKVEIGSEFSTGAAPRLAKLSEQPADGEQRRALSGVHDSQSIRGVFSQQLICREGFNEVSCREVDLAYPSQTGYVKLEEDLMDELNGKLTGK